MKELIYYATLAPSAHNNQPWRFRLPGDRIQVFLDRRTLLTTLDPENLQSYISLGAAIENISVAARKFDLNARIELFPEGKRSDLVAEIFLCSGSSSSEQEKRLAEAITDRHTVRLPFSRQEISKQFLNEIATLASERNARLQIITKHSSIAEVGRLVGKGDKICYEHAEIQSEVYRWMRFWRREEEAVGDGMWIKTFGLDPITEVLAQKLLRWETLRMLNFLGMSSLLGLRSGQMVSKSAAVGLLAVPDMEPESYIRGGMIFQSHALLATLKGLAIHPMNSVPILGLLAKKKPELLTSKQRSSIISVETKLRDRFDILPEEGLIIFFRMGYASPLPYREPRRPIEQVII